MASLTGNTIASTYDGLLKFTDNEAAQSSLKNVTDGLGNATALNLASNQASVSGSLLVTGSILVSGSIIPSVPGGADLTSSFSLGSPEAAWKDLYVSDGTIYFLSREGRVNGTVSAGSDGMAFDGDIKVSNSGSTRISERQAIDIGRGPGASAQTLRNTRVGQAALGTNQSGSNSTAIGYTALSGSTSGDNNTAVGAYAGASNQASGSNNTMIGAATRGNRGIDNTAVGHSALGNHEGGDRNTAIGREALGGLFTGGYNTAIGFQAGVTAKVDTIGSVFIGYDANPPDRNNAPNYELYINSRQPTAPLPASLIPLIGGNFVSRSINLNGRTTLSGSVSISGSVSVSGSIVPAVRAGSTTSSFSLGSPTAAWKDIYVADGTIYMLSGSGTVNGTIAANGMTLNSGSLTINGRQENNYVIAPSLRSFYIYPMNYANAWNSGFVNGFIQVPTFPYLEGDLQSGQTGDGVSTIYGSLKIGSEYYNDTSASQYVRAQMIWRDSTDSGTINSPTLYPKPVFRTIITDNSTILEGSNVNTTIGALVTANGRKHVLTVTGSMLVRGGVSLGISASNQHIITGTTTVSGSVIMSGSIIPVVASGSTTSSFSLGSPTAAWKDIYVSDGTIFMLGSNGAVTQTISTSGSGMAFDSDILVSNTDQPLGSRSPVTVGRGAGDYVSKIQNVAVGLSALISNTSGSINTAIGAGALGNNATGNNNTGVGGSALSSNINGNSNTAVGVLALAFSNGSNNTAVGLRAGYFASSSQANTYVGADAGYENRSGQGNVSLGYNSLPNVVSGNNNIAIGYQAGRFASASSGNNIYIGYQAGATASIVESNKLYINQSSGTPLIGGDFVGRTIELNGATTVSSTTTLNGTTTINAATNINSRVTISGSLVITGSAIAPLPVIQGINSVSEYIISTAGVYTITGSFAGNLRFGDPTLVPGHVIHVINTTNAIINVSATNAPLSGGEGGAIASIPANTYYQFVAAGNNWRGGTLAVV